jgi:nucleoside-diphosphate-sugar epimerase
MTGRRVVVTGAAGFVGANLVRRLMAGGHAVHAVVRPGGDSWRLQGLNDLQVHAVNLIKRESVSSLIATIRPEWIFHLAAHGAYPSQSDRRRMLETNIVAAYNLAEAALQSGVERVINTGSSSEYGVKNHAPAESEGLEPNSDYAVGKASATLLFQSLARRHGLAMPTLRLYSAYGPFEEPSRLIPTLLLAALRATLPPLAQPNVARDFIFIDDVSDAYLVAAGASLSDPGAIYNVSTGQQTTLAELVSMVRKQFGIAQQPRWGSMPNRSWDSTVWVGDSRKLSSELGWRARTSLRDGLERTVGWLAADTSRRGHYEAVIQRAQLLRAA